MLRLSKYGCKHIVKALNNFTNKKDKMKSIALADERAAIERLIRKM